MDISFEDGRGTSSRAKAEGLDHLERAGLKRITGSVQKKDNISRGIEEEFMLFKKIGIM